MWFSAVPCLTCIAIGIIISFFTNAQDPKKLNPDLISPMLPSLFSWWPFVGEQLGNWFEKSIGIGSQYVRHQLQKSLRKFLLVSKLVL